MLNDPGPRIDGLHRRLLAIRSMSNFGELNEESMVLLAEHARERHFLAGDVIAEQGEPLERVHFVVSGEVLVTVDGERAAHIEGNGTVGMLSLLARDPRGVRAVALADTHTLVLPIEVALDLYEESFHFLRTAIRYAALGLIQRRGNLPVRPGYETPASLGTYRDRDPTLVERILAMRSNPLFANRNLDAVVDMARIGRHHHVAPGETLWSIGESADWYLVMSYGRIRCTNEDGDSALVAGDYALGLMDGLSRIPRCYEAVTETEIQAVRVDIGDILSVLETHHDLAMDMLALISRQLLPGAS